jgi:hypothetical protein
MIWTISENSTTNLPLCKVNPVIKERIPSSPIEFPCKCSSCAYIQSTSCLFKAAVSKIHLKLMPRHFVIVIGEYTLNDYHPSLVGYGLEF